MPRGVKSTGARKLNKKEYVAKQKEEKRRAKKETEEDMNQNYRIKEVERKVGQLVKSSKNYVQLVSASTDINTVVGLQRNAVFTLVNQARDLNTINRSTLQGSAVGSSASQRTLWKHIELIYFINTGLQSSLAEYGTGVTVRVMLVCLHNPNGVPGIEDNSTEIRYADVFGFTDPDATTMVSADILSPYTRLKRSNIEILYDQFHVLGPAQIGAGASDGGGLGSGNLLQTPVQHKHLYPSQRSQAQHYNNYDEASVNDYTNVQQNQYWLLFMTDSASNTDPPTITYNVTVDFLE